MDAESSKQQSVKKDNTTNCNLHCVDKTKRELKTRISEQSLSPVARRFNNHNHTTAELRHMGIKAVKTGIESFTERMFLERRSEHTGTKVIARFIRLISVT